MKGGRRRRHTRRTSGDKQAVPGLCTLIGKYWLVRISPDEIEFHNKYYITVEYYCINSLFQGS